MATYKEPCGCVSDEARWIKLCQAHESERAGREHELTLDSLQWLMNHYDKFPNEDNLRHVIKRIKEVGSAVRVRPVLVQWIIAHQGSIRETSHRRV